MNVITRIGIAGGALAGVALIVGPAHASVTINTDGTGFVGKGDIQTAMGWNDKQLQDNAPRVGLISLSRPVSQALTSTASQSATQDGTQSATQAATQSATQTVTETVTETVSCTIDNSQVVHIRSGSRDGSHTGTRTGTHTGSRSATRDASRTGSRTGTRSGTQTGTEAAQVAYTARTNSNGKNGPITGFNLTGWQGTPVTTLSGSPVWGDPTFGAWSYGDWTGSGDFSFGSYTWGDYTWGDMTYGGYTWSAWDSDPTENPASCLGGNPDVQNLSDQIVVTGSTDGGPVAGAITNDVVVPGAFAATADPVPGAITYGDTVFGDTTPAGPWTVTGVTSE